MEGQGRDVVAAFPQGRGVDGENVDAVIQVLPEGPLGNQCLEVLVGGKNESDVGFLDAGIAHRPEFAFLDDTEQFRLGGQGNIPEFIEEERAVVGNFEHAPLVGDRAGE